MALEYSTNFRFDPEVSPHNRFDGSIAFRVGEVTEKGFFKRNNQLQSSSIGGTKFVRKSLCTVMTLIYPIVTYAAHPLITDDTGTQGKKKFQVEVTGEATYHKETDLGGTTRETGGEFSAIVSYGIIDNIDIVLGIPYQWTRVKVGGKILIY